jgi:hypothetical protein
VQGEGASEKKKIVREGREGRRKTDETGEGTTGRDSILEVVQGREGLNEEGAFNPTCRRASRSFLSPAVAMPARDVGWKELRGRCKKGWRREGAMYVVD